MSRRRRSSKCKLNTRHFNAYLFSSPLWWRLSVTIAAPSRRNGASTLKSVVVSSFNRTAVHHRALLLLLLLVWVFPDVAVMAAPLLQPRHPSCLKGKEEVRSQTGGQRWGFTLGTFSDIFIYEVVYLLPFFWQTGAEAAESGCFWGEDGCACVSCVLGASFIHYSYQTEVHINNGELVDVKCSAE